jgi:hypothetical protein
MKCFHTSENLIRNETVYFLSHSLTLFSTTEVAEFANQPLMNTMEMPQRQTELRLPEAVSLVPFFCHSLPQFPCYLLVWLFSGWAALG